MRNGGGWISLGSVVLVAFLAACGDDDAVDDHPGADATGAGGRAGADGGRPDSSAGGGGNGGKAGTAGTGGSAGQSGGSAGTGGSAAGAAGTGGGAGSGATAGAGGALDASVDRSSDGAAGLDATTDEPAVDARAEPDSTGIADSSLDQNGSRDGDVAIVDASDAMADVNDAGDAAPMDAGPSDANDGSPDTFDALSCTDNNAASFDFYSALYGCGHRFDANPNDGDAWITYDAGFHVDVATGLGWAFPGGFRSASAAASECDALTVAGLADWRMPTIDDARTLAGGCAPTMAGGTCPLHDPSCLTLSCGQQQPACSSCLGGAGPHPDHGYCKVDVAVCTHFHTSSLCSDCGDASAKNWIYGPSNGNFIEFDPPLGIPTACVSIVPGGVPVTDGG